MQLTADCARLIVLVPDLQGTHLVLGRHVCPNPQQHPHNVRLAAAGSSMQRRGPVNSADLQVHTNVSVNAGCTARGQRCEGKWGFFMTAA